MIGKRLKDIRVSKDLSGQEMAEFLGLPYRTYINYERDERSPGLEKLLDIANRLNVSIDYLMGNSQYPERVEDFIKNPTKKDPEITDKDLAALGLKESNVINRLKDLPGLIHEQRIRYEERKAILTERECRLQDITQTLKENPNSEDKIRYDQCRQTLDVAIHEYHKTESMLKKLEEEYNVLMKLLDLSVAINKEAP